MINVARKSISEYISFLKRGVAFSLTRYWDGEMHAIVGRTGKNVDSCEYTSELGDALRKTITNNKDYYHCLYYPMDHRCTRMLRRSFLEYLIEAHSKVLWYDAMVFQNSFTQGNFYLMVQALKDRNTIMVGGEHLRPLVDKFNVMKYFIDIPARNAFEQRNGIEERVKTIAGQYHDPVFVFCAGMASNVFIDDLFGIEATMIDMGSVWDACLQLSTRQWMRKVPEHVVRRNLYGK